MYKVTENLEGLRLDKALVALAGETRSTVKQWLDEKRVTVNRALLKPSYKVVLGDVIEVAKKEETILDLEPIDLNLEIVYQDDDLAVINKPVGLTVHPSHTTKEPTLVHGIMHQIKDLGAFDDVIRPGIVHRLDKDTSGLLVVAKNKETLLALQKALQDRLIKREYVALVKGVIKPDKGTIDAPIGRHPKERQSMAVIASGKPSITHFEVLKRFSNSTLIKCILDTGRTHQIRVHLSHLGHPVLNDPKYGSKFDTRMGQLLHAKKLSFIHPKTQKSLSFEAPIPIFFDEYLSKNE